MHSDNETDTRTGAREETSIEEKKGVVRLCGAKTRSGRPCPTYAMPNGRCRMHGGTNPGAPLGNKNRWVHGRRSAETKAFYALLRRMRAELAF
ncbi:HGGxSTG domain-containing protein [Sphingomonas piscis]|uniref:HGGxSTG domain-containing protein n=1 Tax=Sphingomonas piscis TaxID=2714943 RepID=UPI003CCDA725